MKNALLLLSLSLLLLTSRAQTVSYANATAGAETKAAAPASANALAGTWAGPLALPGRSMRVSLTVTQSGGHLAAMIETDGTGSQRAMSLTERRDTLRFYDPVAQVSYECQRSPTRGWLVGRWQQPGFSEVLVLRYEAAGRQAARRTANASKWANGDLEKGQRVGLWQYYRYAPDGARQLAQVYDHSAGKMLYAVPDNDLHKTETAPGAWSHTQLAQSPWFVGGDASLAAFAAKIQYPEAALNARVEGKVTVSFVVDTLGRVTDYAVVRGLSHGCDAEALRVARTIPDTWVPGRLGTKPVAVLQYLSFTFRMP